MAKPRVGTIEIITGAIGGALLSPILRICWKLIENEILGWSDDQIAGSLSRFSPLIHHFVSSAVAWGPPAAVAAVCMGIAYRLGLGRQQQNADEDNDAAPANNSLRHTLQHPITNSPVAPQKVLVPIELLRAHLLIDLANDVSFPASDGISHLGHEAVRLVDANGAANGAGEVTH